MSCMWDKKLLAPFSLCVLGWTFIMIDRGLDCNFAVQ